MDLEEVYRTVSRAEETQDFLHDGALRYENYVEDFYSEDEDSYPVSRELLLDETRHFVNLIRTHEEIYSRLEEARDEIEDINDFRVLPGIPLDQEGLAGKINELIDVYEEYFDYAWEVGLKTHEDPSAPDPIHLKYRQWQKKQMEPPEDAVKKAMKGLEQFLPQ